MAYVAERLTTRYGRVSVRLSASAASAAAYVVRANVSLPAGVASRPPAGGVRVRVRAPLAHAGRLSSVAVGGAAWRSFDAAAETIDFAAADLTPALLASGLPDIVATFG